METILPTLSKDNFDAAMHRAVEQSIVGVRAGWHPDAAWRTDVKTVVDNEGRRRHLIEWVFTMTMRRIDNGDVSFGDSGVRPSAALTTGESLALSVLFDNKPAHALADFLQEEGLIPVPRETVAQIVSKLIEYAYYKRMNAPNAKYRGTAMDNAAWTVVEGLLSEVAEKLATGGDVYDWK